MSDSPALRRGVALLHGLGRSYRCMKRLERRLQAEGYDTLNIDYPTCRFSLADHAARLAPQIGEFARGVSKVSFIGFSMGGLVIRELLAGAARPANLDCVIMLGTPNGGSEVADFLCANKFSRSLFTKICGPVALELRVAHQLQQKPMIDYPLYVVAGITRLDPLVSQIIKSENDGMVAIEKTKLPDMAGHTVVRGTHTFLPENKAVIDAAIKFLVQGNRA